jgi:uncharacterized membrane protein YphA (DoxX/SURF4 family)
VSTGLLSSSANVALAVIPGDVIWSYSVAAVILAIGIAVILLHDWSKAHGLDKLLLLGPLFYAAPLAAFGTEHFTRAAAVASIVPEWIPWHLFWTYLVGACFIGAALSLVTRIQTRLAASLLALTFFLFVVLMDIPAWAQDPKDRFALALVLRELSFSGGALALAASLHPGERRAELAATIARYVIATTVLVYSVQQFMHGDHVPGVPLNRTTPEYVRGHGLWTYLTALVYALAGGLLLVGKKTRIAATGLGLTVLLIILVVYVPIGVMDRASLDLGFNFLADTLMFCGAILLLANAMPREASLRQPSATALQPGS